MHFLQTGRSSSHLTRLVLPQESNNVYVRVVCGDTHRQVLQPLRVGLLLTTRFLFAGTSFSSITACFPIFAAMLEGQYRGHGIDGSSEEIRHVVLKYHWFLSLDALPLVRSFAKRRNGPPPAAADEAESITATRNHEQARQGSC